MLTKVCIVKAMVFPVVMYGCESWTIKKAEHRRIDILKLWCCWLLRVPWTTRRSNQSILKEINPEYSLEGLMLKLKLQYFGHMMQRADSLVKTLILGKIEGRRRKGWQRMRWMDHWPNGHDFEQTLGDGEGQGSLVSCSPWSRKESDTTERLNNKSLLNPWWMLALASSRQVWYILEQEPLYPRCRAPGNRSQGLGFYLGFFFVLFRPVCWCSEVDVCGFGQHHSFPLLLSTTLSFSFGRLSIPRMSPCWGPQVRVLQSDSPHQDLGSHEKWHKVWKMVVADLFL